jgi:hypothetical protein
LIGLGSGDHEIVERHFWKPARNIRFYGDFWHVEFASVRFKRLGAADTITGTSSDQLALEFCDADLLITGARLG